MWGGGPPQHYLSATPVSDLELQRVVSRAGRGPFGHRGRDFVSVEGGPHPTPRTSRIVVLLSHAVRCGPEVPWTSSIRRCTRRAGGLLRCAPPAPSRERKGRAASASEPRPLRCGGWGTGEKAGLGHGGTGGPPGPYFRATPVPRNSSCVRLRVLDSKGGPFGSPGICLGEISGRSFRFRNRSITCRIASDLPGSRTKYRPGGPPSPAMP